MADRYQPFPARYGRAQHDREGNYDRYDRYERGRSPPPRGHAPPSRYDDRDGGGYTFRGAAASRDNYRPEDNFTFRARGPPAPRFPAPDRHHPPAQPQKPHLRRDQGKRGPPGRHGDRTSSGRWRGAFKPPPAHTRDILHTTRRASTPEQLLGMNIVRQARFATVDSSSDEDGGDKKLDSLAQSSDLEEGEAPRKRVKTGISMVAEPAVSKWSNPDPYTSLPPPETLGAPKKDIVEVIRKAKIEPLPRADSTNAVKDNDDFISFNFDDNLPDAQISDDGDSANGIKPPHSAPAVPENLTRSEMANGKHMPSGNNFSIPPQASAQLTKPFAANTMNDSIGAPLPPPSGLIMPTYEELAAQYAGDVKGKKRKRDMQSRSQGEITEEWQANATNPTPWCTVDHSHTANVGLRLHKEICDFFEFVRPHDYEEAARRDLIKRVQSAVGRMGGAARDVEIYCFGSFAAGLYLPTADMDLVAVSPMFLSKGAKTYCQTPRKIHALGRYLETCGIAAPGTVSPVTRAKVPIVKFTDKKTGIKVDISFENKSGLVANATFHNWKVRYPAMPVIVVLIKQLLAMRDLNEVFTGGLGGFSIICLVVSMMQMMPEIQSGSMDPQQHYGDLLLNFLDLYGSKLDIRTTGIEMNPPGYFDKIGNPRQMQNLETLTIIDPNRADNDISGGSRNIESVLSCFHSAHAEIQRRLAQIHSGYDIEDSILGRILGGNYSPFIRQRNNFSLIQRGLVVNPPPVPQKKAPGAPRPMKQEMREPIVPGGPMDKSRRKKKGKRQ